jgi:cyclophilin family peptidyl-prolyl cis-trans isomerase/HEAT repeat protein
VTRRAGIVLGLLAAIQPGGAQSPQRLSQADREIYSRIMLLADTRTLDTTTVDAGLTSRTNTVRAYTVLTLGQLGRERAAPRVHGVVAALRERDVLVAMHAAYALGLWRDSAFVGPLTTALRSDHRIGVEAAWAIGQIGEPSRASIIAALEQARGFPSGVRIQLLLAAAKLRPVPLASVIPYLSSEHASTRWAAAYAIARTRVPGGVRPLLGLVSIRPMPPKGGPPGVLVATSPLPPGSAWYELRAAAPHRIQAEVARALTSQAAGDSLGDTAFSALEHLVGDPHPHVRINALRSLATYDVRARDLLIGGTRNANANVRIAAAQALATARSLGVVDWEQLWLVDTSFAYRRSIIESALAHRATLVAVPVWRTHPDWRFRAAIATAVASAGDRESWRNVAIELARDPDARVRSAGLAALTGDSTDLNPSIREIVLDAVHDTSVTVRATAVRALRRWRQPADLDLVFLGLQCAGGDRESDARVAAIEYLAEAWERDSAGMEATAARLRSLAVSGDPVSRAAAAKLTPLAHWRRLPIPARSRAFYRDVVDRIVVPALSGRPARASIVTERGRILVDLFGATAPLTVYNFITIARSGRYDGLRFHRVVPNFVVQDGDPAGDGNGGPGYTIRDELNPVRYERGVVGMALSGPDTGGSQYFITLSPQPHLDGGYTVFGRVFSVDIAVALDAIVQGDRIQSVEIH